MTTEMKSPRLSLTPHSKYIERWDPDYSNLCTMPHSTSSYNNEDCESFNRLGFQSIMKR